MDFGTEQGSRTKITNWPTGNCHANKTPSSLPYQSHPRIFRQVRQRWPEKPESFSLSGAALCNPKREARGSVENKAFTMTPDNCATDRGGISITRWHRAHPSSVSIRSIRAWQSRSAFGASGEGHASRCIAGGSLPWSSLAHPLPAELRQMPQLNNQQVAQTTRTRQHFPSFSSSSGALGRGPR